MHSGGDDVVRRLTTQLDQVFAQVRLDRLDPGPLQVPVQPHLLGQHGLALDYGPDAARPREVQDVLGSRGSVLSEEHASPRFLDVRGGHVQVVVEVLDCVSLDRAGPVTQVLPAGRSVAGTLPALVEIVVQPLHVPLDCGVRDRAGRALLERPRLQIHLRPWPHRGAGPRAGVLRPFPASRGRRRSASGRCCRTTRPHPPPCPRRCAACRPAWLPICRRT